jgi:hypothetical protein
MYFMKITSIPFSSNNFDLHVSRKLILLVENATSMLLRMASPFTIYSKNKIYRKIIEIFPILERYLCTRERYLFMLERYLFHKKRYLFKLKRYLFKPKRYLFKLKRYLSKQKRYLSKQRRYLSI